MKRYLIRHNNGNYYGKGGYSLSESGMKDMGVLLAYGYQSKSRARNAIKNGFGWCPNKEDLQIVEKRIEVKKGGDKYGI